MADICVPCVTSGDGSGWLTYEGGAGLEAVTGSARTQQRPDGDLFVDLSASGTLNGQDYTFQALFLRSGENYFPLLHRSHGDAGPLASIAAGETRGLVLKGFSSVLLPDSQASLVYYVCEREGAPEDCFWTSTPILTQPSR